MVARGDLGVEINAAEVPLIQKKLVNKAKKGKNSCNNCYSNDGKYDEEFKSK
jgi:hypothetical protein